MDLEAGPASFVDAAGKRWIVDVTVATARRLRSADLIDVDDPQCLDAIIGLEARPIQLVAVLYVALAPQIEAAGLDEEGFAARFAGEVLHDAVLALLRAFARFFRSPALREAMLQAAAGIERVEREGVEMVRERMAEEINRATASLRATPFGGSSPASPESAASTPAA